jgi:hypothetical protein
MYQLLRKPGSGDRGWWYWRDDRGILHDFNGPFQLLGDAEIVAVDDVAEDWDQLDWSKTSLCPDVSTVGWLSPSGEFMPCPSHGHDRYARFVLHKKVALLEKGGWARIYGSVSETLKERRRARDAWCCLRSITPEQHLWLEAHEHEVKDYD